MRTLLVAGAAALASGACVSPPDPFGPGFYGTAYIPEGRVSFPDPMPSLDDCVVAVRAAESSPDPSALGRVVKGPNGAAAEGLSGICGGPGGRSYLVTPTEIRPGPTLVIMK